MELLYSTATHGVNENRSPSVAGRSVECKPFSRLNQAQLITRAGGFQRLGPSLEHSYSKAPRAEPEVPFTPTLSTQPPRPILSDSRASHF